MRVFTWALDFTRELRAEALEIVKKYLIGGGRSRVKIASEDLPE